MGSIREAVVDLSLPLKERHPELMAAGQTIIDLLELPPFSELSQVSAWMPVGVISRVRGEGYIIPAVKPAEVVRTILIESGQLGSEPQGNLLRLDSPIRQPVAAFGHRINCRLKPDAATQEELVRSLELLAKKMPGITSKKGAVALLKELKQALHNGVDFYAVFEFPQARLWIDLSQPPEDDLEE